MIEIHYDQIRSASSETLGQDATDTAIAAKDRVAARKKKQRFQHHR